MKNLSIKKLYKLYHKVLSENYSDSDLDIILELISQQELNENTSATGGPSGDAGSSTVGYGSIGVGLRTTVGPVPSTNPQRSSGNLAGSDWINGGKSGDVETPFNPSGSNRVFQKTPVMGKGHGAMTGKKSRVKPLDLKALRDVLKNKNKQTDMKPRTGKVMNFDDFQKGEITNVTKVKEGKTHKSSKPDKKVGKEGLRLTDKKENFRTEVKNLIKSHDDFNFKQVGNDLSIHKDGEHILQVMFRDDYVGVQKNGNKFPKEFEYNELGKIKKEIGDILKSKKD
jgi:hypothetical protein